MKDFLDLPKSIYEKDDKYIPVFDKAIMSELSIEKNPFYRYGKSMMFIAYSRSGPIGRLVAFRNSKMDFEDKKLGLIGYFEVIDDFNISKLMLDEAFKYLKAEGSNLVYGPMNHSIWNVYRFKLSHFNEHTYYGEPYNKEYYPEHFENYGFRLLEKWSTSILDVKDLNNALLEKCKRFARHHKRALDLAYEFYGNKKANFDNELQEVHQLIMDSFSDFLAYYPIDYEEFEYFYGSLRKIIEDDQIIYAKKNSKLHGALILYYDMAKTLKSMKGKLNLISVLKFKFIRDKTRTVCPFLAASSESQKGMEGIGTSLIYLKYKYLLENNIPFEIQSLMSDSNASLTFGADIGRIIGTYGLFKKPL